MYRSELENQLREYSRRISQLEYDENRRDEVIYNDGGEVKYRTNRPNHQSEITELRRQRAKVEKQLDELKAAELDRKLHPQVKDEKSIDEAENNRLQQFETLKKMYEGKSLSNRFLKKINGKAPKWDQIKNYSLEELYFLSFINYGSTVYQQEKEEEKRERYAARGLSETEINKKIQEERFETFSNSLANKSFLQDIILGEEANRKAGKHI